jgi:hypothetical protein
LLAGRAVGGREPRKGTCAFVTGGNAAYLHPADCILCRLKALETKHARVLAVFPPRPGEDALALHEMQCVDTSVHLVVYPFIPNPYSTYNRHLNRSQLGAIRSHVKQVGLHHLAFPPWAHVMTKVNVFRTLAEDFERLVWLDPDMLLMQNVDELCELPQQIGFAATHCPHNRNCFNSGVMAFQTVPLQRFDAHFLKPLEALQRVSYDAADQGYITSAVLDAYQLYKGTHLNVEAMLRELKSSAAASPRPSAENGTATDSGAKSNRFYYYLHPNYNWSANSYPVKLGDREAAKWIVTVRSIKVIHFMGANLKPWNNNWTAPATNPRVPIAIHYLKMCPNMAAMCQRYEWCSGPNATRAYADALAAGAIPCPATANSR